MCTVALWCLFLIGSSSGAAVIPMTDEQTCRNNANKIYLESRERRGPYVYGYCVKD